MRGGNRSAGFHRLHPAGSRVRCHGSHQEKLHAEFRNRLDTIIQFGRLSHDVIKSIVDKFLIELQAQLEDKHVTLEVSDAARVGWQSTAMTPRWVHGRWPLIQDKIKRPLAERSCSESWPSTAVWCISIFVTASRSSNSKPLPNWPDGRSTSARLLPGVFVCAVC